MCRPDWRKVPFQFTPERFWKLNPSWDMPKPHVPDWSRLSLTAVQRFCDSHSPLKWIVRMSVNCSPPDSSTYIISRSSNTAKASDSLSYAQHEISNPFPLYKGNNFPFSFKQKEKPFYDPSSCQWLPFQKVQLPVATCNFWQPPSSKSP